MGIHDLPPGEKLAWIDKTEFENDPLDEEDKALLNKLSSHFKEQQFTNHDISEQLFSEEAGNQKISLTTDSVRNGRIITIERLIKHGLAEQVGERPNTFRLLLDKIEAWKQQK